MVKVKICGITNLKDARQAIDAGATFIGFNFYKRSPRYLSPSAAKRIIQRLPKKVKAVGVFVNETEDKMLTIARHIRLSHVQLHGEESPETVARLQRTLPVIKAIRVRKSFSTSSSSFATRVSAHSCSMVSIVEDEVAAAKPFVGISRAVPNAPAIFF